LEDYAEQGCLSAEASRARYLGPAHFRKKLRRERLSVLKFASKSVSFSISMKGPAMQRVEAKVAVSVSDLKKSPTAIMAQAGGEAVAVLNHNRVMAYMVPADAYEAMIERLDDLELAETARERAGEVPVRVTLDEL
jgi:antitoxin StbD